MKLKIIILFQLLCGIAISQITTDSTNVKFESLKKFEENLNTVQTDIEKLNKIISGLDSLFNTNKIVVDGDINKLEKSIEKSKIDLNKSISNIEETLNQNLTNSNLRFDELSIMINSLTDSLLTNANSILRIKQQNSFNEAFLIARLTLGANQKFEWNGKLYKTDYDNEMKASPIVIAIDSLKYNLELKSEQLDKAIATANSQIATLDNYIEKVKDENKSQIKSLDQSINKTISDRTLYWIIAILVLLILLIIVFFFLKSKVTQQQDSLSSVKDTQEKLESDSIKLDTKLIEIFEQKLEVAQQQPQQTQEVDHSLPLKLGEEIHRMRKRLKIMDESQGTKVLNKRIESLEEKINNMGYEIVNLEGKPYDERMTLNVLNIIESDDLSLNEKIISRVIKPRVKYNGEIKQPGDVEVTQGIKEN